MLFLCARMSPNLEMMAMKNPLTLEVSDSFISVKPHSRSEPRLSVDRDTGRYFTVL